MAGTGRVEQAPTETVHVRRGLWGVRTGRGARSYLLLLTSFVTIFNLYLIFMVAPTDAVLGHVQRVFYVHFPLAMMSFLAFLGVFVGGVLYLVRRGGRWDYLAQATAEVGLVFITLALLTGIIWAKPVWNAWWLWTPRLTTTLILWLIYAAYLMIRGYAPSQAKAALYGSVVGIIGFIDVVVVYFSVQWWPGIHPAPVVGPLAERDALEPTMQAVLVVSFVSFFLLLVYLVSERMAQLGAEEGIRSLRFRLRRAPGQPSRE